MATIENMDSLTRRLLVLGNQAMALASEIGRHENENCIPGDSAFEPLKEDSALWHVLAEELYRERGRRKEFFPATIFGEPAWDILLDLYIAEKRNQYVSVSSACIGSNSPPTTGLRWLQLLEELALVERSPDPKDGRRSFVRITERGYSQMTAYFVSTRRHWLRDDVLRRRLPLFENMKTDTNLPYIMDKPK